MQITSPSADQTPLVPITRDQVLALEREIQKQPPVDFPIRHYYAPGLYAREITIRKGYVLTGAVHKTENLAVLSAGRLLLVTENGVVEVAAPHTLTVKPGQKNAAYALEDSVWTNFFPTTETDPDKLVELLTESKASELIGGSDNVQATNHRLEQ
ncbi:hypothetical protein [Ralstonia insidiosa]|uniref:hypothetical protein n=1 Tax=Ralstonia insidiosa TaxID=190721 RepID=UPI001427A810|nr:hypothetical protein [Ralstonia insidiosa]